MKKTKVVNKIIAMLSVFMIMFSNFGYTLSAIATSDGFEVITNGFFQKEELEFKAYFEENGKETKEKISNVNENIKLKVKVTPKVDGYLKTATIKAVSETEEEPNFKIKSIETLSDDLNVKGNENKDRLVNLGKKDENKEEEQNKVSENTTNDLKNSTVTENTIVGSEEQNVVKENFVTNETAEKIENNTSVENVNEVTNESSKNTTNEVANVTNTIETAENTTSTASVVNTTDVTNTAENTVNETNTTNVANTVANEVKNNENNVVEEKEENPEFPTTAGEEEVLVEEDKVIEEKSAEANSEDIDFTSDAKVISENEVTIQNVIEETTYVIEIEYEQKETLKIEDLYKEIKLQMSGTYINVDLEEVKIGKEEKVKVGWEYSKDIEISSEYTKFSPFKIGEKTGTIVENKITVTRETEDEKYLPIKETKIEIKVPTFNGKAPIEVGVTASKLLATKGEDIGEVNFSSENWSYEEKSGKIEIITKNEKEGIAKNTKGKDEYTVIYRYEDYTEDITSKLNRNVKVEVEEYSGKENKKIKKKIKEEQEVKVNVGELVTYSIDTTKEKVEKSKIYANYNSEEALYETEYTSHVAVNILTSDMLEKLNIDCSKEVYKDINGYEFKAEGIEYKQVKFNYSDIKQILEKGGNIEVYNEKGELLYTLDKNLITKEEDCVLNVNYAKGINIVINNIEVNGTINFELTKVIKKCNYEKAALKNFTEIASKITAEVKYSNIEETLKLEEISTSKELKESYTRANIYINRENLTTIQENENVELKVELNNDKEDSDLYVNPSFEFVFPKYVKEVNVESINLLYENGLKVSDFETYKESDIVKMRVELEGKQKTFSESTITNGTNILINVKIKVDEYTPSKEDQIKLYYCNEGVSNYESQTKWTIGKKVPNGILKTTNGFDVALFKYQAPSGLVAINGIKNYDGKLNEIKSVKQGEITKEIARGTESKIATMELLTLNNTGNKCTDVVMLGRIPFKGNKDVITNKDLGTTTTGEMKDFIKEDVANANMATIYYSANENATKSLEDGANGWRIAEGVSNIGEMKSYMIVVKGEVEAGAVLRYSYDFEIPEKLEYEVSMAGSFGAYYNNNSEVAVVYESTVADKVGVTTEAGPKVEAFLSVDIGDGTEVGECRFLNYTLEVKNTGSVRAENIEVTNPVPKYAKIVGTNNEHDIVYNIEKLEPQESNSYKYELKTKEFPDIESFYSDYKLEKDENGYYYIDENSEVSVSNSEENIDNNDDNINITDKKKIYVDPNYEVFIENKATIKVENLAITIESNTTKNKLKHSNFDIDINNEVTTDSVNIGEQSYYTVSARNISGNTLENIIGEIYLPQNLEYIDSTVKFTGRGVNFDDENYVHLEEYNKNNIIFDDGENHLQYKIDELYDEEIINISIIYKVKDSDLDRKEVYMEFVTDNKVRERSKTESVLFTGPKLEVEQTTNFIENFVKEGEDVEFLITIKNIGNGEANNLKIVDNISENLKNITADISGDISSDVSVSSNKINKKIDTLEADKKIVLKIKGKATELDAPSIEKNIINVATISADYVDEIETEEAIVKIYYNPDKKKDTIDSDFSDDKKSEINNPTNEDKSPNDTTNDTNNDSKIDSKDTNSTNDSLDNEQNNNIKNNTPNNNEINSNNDTKTNGDNKVEEKYSISGVVWLDSNKNGRRDENEKNISSIKVQLLKSGTMIKATSTDGNGNYNFTELSNGKYTIKYLYDGENYTTTIYNGRNIEEGFTSKAVENEKGSAVSNTIEINGKSVDNINVGLIKREIFNLSINKYITKSILKTKKREEVFDYDNLQLGKVEIKSKELIDAEVTLEYAIIIKNEGEIPGKATSIIDYIPKGMEINKDNSKDWYVGEDGNAYNDTLKETTINPGETKELKIVLTKKMNENNTGVVSNKVSILGTENEKGATSTNENNTNTQEMLIIIGTGKTTKNIVIVVFVIMIITMLIIAINPKELYKKFKNIKVKKIYR